MASFDVGEMTVAFDAEPDQQYKLIKSSDGIRYRDENTQKIDPTDIKILATNPIDWAAFGQLWSDIEKGRKVAQPSISEVLEGIHLYYAEMIDRTYYSEDKYQDLKSSLGQVFEFLHLCLKLVIPN